jgi:hypothetical protein
MQIRCKFVGFEVFTAVVMKSIIFWDMTACHRLARWFAEPISSTLKMEAICSSETSVETQRTTRRHTPEDDTLHVANTSSYTIDLFFYGILEMKSAVP